MPKSNIVLLEPYNNIVDSTIKTSTATINGNIGISTNETLTHYNFCIQYSNHTFDALKYF